MAAPSSTAAAAIKAAKRSLRKSMAVTLAGMAREDIASQSQRVARKVLTSPTYHSARSISVYVNMDVGEVMTDDICRAILRDGKSLYVPLFASPVDPAAAKGPTVDAAPAPAATTFATDMVMLRLRDLAEYEAMKLNRWGIKEPELTYQDGTLREEALTESTGGDGLDLILAPGVAFDVDGGRLGHGKGYYDRYFTRADQWAQGRGRPGPVTVALALSQQVLASELRVPADERDHVLDAILSPELCIRPSRTASRWIPGEE
ncbi:related to 5-formyltetrahydrofolate cyclo-ligase [Pseudozyma flocculosa]|nr:related to 5-formyltetrahydrofolate cyclo-ligase [Pseudozyma flocculosa]